MAPAVCSEVLFGGSKKELEGLILLCDFILCSEGSHWAPEQGRSGAFSRFCMLLLKASYCISFCLSLPTCNMGPTPPTSLKSPGFQHTTGSGCGRQPFCTTGIRGQTLECLLPPPLAPHRPVPGDVEGLGLNVPASPMAPSSCSATSPLCTISSLRAVSPLGPVLQAPLECPGEPNAAPGLVSRAVLGIIVSPVIWGLEARTQPLGGMKSMEG